MRVAAEKLPGAAEVAVSLNDGVLAIRFEGDHPTTLGQVREVIYNNAFTPREADLRLAGSVVSRADGPALAVPGHEGVYPLVGPGGEWPELPAPGTRVVVQARAPETPRRAAEPPALVVLGVSSP